MRRTASTTSWLVALGTLFDSSLQLPLICSPCTALSAPVLSPYVPLPQTLVPPHSSVPRAHYPDIDSEADVSSDDLRDPDDDEADSEDDTRQQQQHQRHDEGDGYYKGGKYRAFQVSKHSLYVRAIARYREEVAGEERKERTEDRGKEERLDDGEHREERASDRKGGKREKEGMDETEEEEEESTRKKKHKRDDKSKGDRKSKNGGRRRSVTVLDDDDDFV